jgi:hypothetical protein
VHLGREEDALNLRDNSDALHAEHLDQRWGSLYVTKGLLLIGSCIDY